MTPDPDDVLIATDEAYGESEEDFLASARRRFDLVVEAESKLRGEMTADLTFYKGDQWDKDVLSARNPPGPGKRPCLVINRLPGMVHQVSNAIRQDKPAAKISPIDDSGDIETAEIFQGLIRHIEQQSNAAAVRSYAAFYAIVTGRGYYRVLTDYTDPMAPDQDILIRRIKNPLSVYMDPAAQEPDGSDAKWCFIVEDMTEEEFKVRYPGKELSSAEDFGAEGDTSAIWRWQGNVRTVEYFCKKTRPVEIAMVADPDRGPLAVTMVPLDQVPQGVEIHETRTTEAPYVHWYRIDGAQILEEKEWPGKYIPVIPVLGEEFNIDGTTELVGMVRNSRDPQRMLNYWESAKTETIALAPRVPWIAAEGQFEGHEAEWAQANVRNFAYLQYKPTSVAGQPLPPPQRQVYEPPVQAISMAEMQTVDHLKSTTGVYDASLGNRSNETTGIAIRSRQVQGETSNYHYIDALATAVTHETRILIDLIPKVYDRAGRVARIIGEDGQAQKVLLNAPHTDESGIEKIYDLGAGKYDVAVSIGPSYATKRQESADSMLGFAQAAPELVPRWADLFAQAQDWPGAQEIADRVRPADVPAKGEPPIPPQAQQQISQLQQENQQLKMAADQMAQIIQGKQVETSSKERMQTQKIESDERMAAEKNQASLISKAADVGSKDSIALLQAEIMSIQHRLNLLQSDQPVDGQQQPIQQRQ